MSALSTLAKMLGLADETAANDAMRSERVYRATLSRRSLFAAAGALAAGTVMVPGSELVAYKSPWTDTMLDMSKLVLLVGGVHVGAINGYAKRKWIKEPSF